MSIFFVPSNQQLEKRQNISLCRMPPWNWYLCKFSQCFYSSSVFFLFVWLFIARQHLPEMRPASIFITNRRPPNKSPAKTWQIFCQEMKMFLKRNEVTKTKQNNKLNKTIWNCFANLFAILIMKMEINLFVSIFQRFWMQWIKRPTLYLKSHGVSYIGFISFLFVFVILKVFWLVWIQIKTLWKLETAGNQMTGRRKLDIKCATRIGNLIGILLLIIYINLR